MIHEVLRLVDINLELNSVEILNHVNLNVQRGEVLGVTGLRYAGKSSLMHVLSGDTQSDSGRIYFGETLQANWNEAVANQSGVVNVSAFRNVYANLAAMENIFLTRREDERGVHYRHGIARTRCEALFAKLHIEIPLKATPAEMCYFDRFQVSFAKAIASNAQVLLIDEVISRINESQLEQLYFLISQASEMGVAVVLFDSDFETIMRVASRMYILRNGYVTALIERKWFDAGQVHAHILGNTEKAKSICSRYVWKDAALEVFAKDGGFRRRLFSVQRGSITGIVIPQGKDADALLNAMLWKCGEYEIHICGERANRKAVRGEIGLMYDMDTYLPNLSLYENLTLLPGKTGSIMDLFIDRYETYTRCNMIIERCFQEDFRHMYYRTSEQLDYYECKIVTMVRLLNKGPKVMVYANPEHRLAGLKTGGILPRIAEANALVKGSLIVTCCMDICKYVCDTIYVMLDERTFVKYRSNPNCIDG